MTCFPMPTASVDRRFVSEVTNLPRRLVTALLAMCAGVAQADDVDAAELVDIRTVAPDIALDIRYASDHNFVGTRIDGYDAARCLLLPAVAAALARVEQSLRVQQQRLLLFDCYRPQRAVAHFMRWTHAADDPVSKATYYPNVAKSALVPDYIAAQSGHSRGDTVDLTLMQCDLQGTDCQALNMGTPFDFWISHLFQRNVLPPR